MEEGAVNPKYAAMDNSVVEQVFQTLGEENEWTNYLKPKKDSDSLLWGWTHNDMENKDFPKT